MRPHIASLLAASLLCPTVPSRAFATGILTNAWDVGRLSEQQYRERIGFELTGTVITPVKFDSFILQSGESRLYARLPADTTVPEAGSVVTIRGQTDFDFNRQSLLSVTSLVVTAQAPVPPPASVTARQLKDGDYNLQVIRIRGTVADAFHDEIDYRWDQFVMRDGTETFLMAVPKRDSSETDLDRYIGTEIEVTGTYLANLTGRRNFMAPVITLNDYSDLRICQPAPHDPFDAPDLEFVHHIQPSAIAKLGRRRVSGTVLASWQGRHFLLSTGSGEPICVTTQHNRGVPCTGEHVEVIGFPETDLFHINISKAIFRTVPGAPAGDGDKPLDTTADQILLCDGNPRIDAAYHGRLIRLTGIVRNLSPQGFANRQFLLESNGFQVPVDYSSIESQPSDIGLDHTVRVTGICLMGTENWRPDAVFPRLNGFTLVLRTADDVRVLARPPWWTPGRMMLIVGALLATLLAIFIWNRILNRMVEQRSRKLMREEIARAGAELKLEERMRLAVELHDTIAQNLTGVALQIDAAQMAFEQNPSAVAPYLETTRRKMQCCRENLRDCLWDLRSRAFEERELGEAVRKTIAPHAKGVDVRIDSDILSRNLSDNTVHAVLCIVRELVVNAVRHGQARTISVSVRLLGEKITLKVADDGSGFVPAERPGMAEGHFGLQGIAERVHRLGGKLAIDSAPGRGTTVTVTGLETNG